MLIPLPFFSGYLHTSSAEFNICKRDYMVNSALNIYSLALNRKSLLTFGIYELIKAWVYLLLFQILWNQLVFSFFVITCNLDMQEA